MDLLQEIPCPGVPRQLGGFFIMHIINQRMRNFFVPHRDAQPDKLVSHMGQGCTLQPRHQFRCPLYPVLSCKGAFYLRPVHF